MKSFAAFCLIILLVSCSPSKQKKANILFQPKDKEILEKFFELNKEDKNTAPGTLMIKVGIFLEKTPYVAQTLESDSIEQLAINLRELDCTTFAENCLAITRTIRSGKPTWEKFIKELKTIRYRSGIIDKYPSRLHYFSDWIFDNSRKNLVKSISKDIASTIYINQVDFMSNHPDNYRQLKENPEFVQEIKKLEEEISSRITYYIPEEKISEVENQLMDGDIVGITTNIKGLDISHVGILIRKAGRIHLMHASSAAMEVVVSNNTLEDYLLKSKSATGIMVARPL